MPLPLNDGALRELLAGDMEWLEPFVGASLEGRHIMDILRSLHENPSPMRLMTVPKMETTHAQD